MDIRDTTDFLRKHFTEPDTIPIWRCDPMLSNNLLPEPMVNDWRRVFTQNIEAEIPRVVEEYNTECDAFNHNTKLYYQVTLNLDTSINYEYDYLYDIKWNWNNLYQYIADASDWRHTGQGPYTNLSIPFVVYNDEQINIPGSSNARYYRNLTIDQIVPFENEHELPLYELSFKEHDVVSRESGMCHSTFVFYQITLYDILN